MGKEMPPFFCCLFACFSCLLAVSFIVCFIVSLFVFQLCRTLCGISALQPGPRAVKARRANHRTAREFPCLGFSIAFVDFAA